MALFKKKEKTNEIPHKISNKSVEYSIKSKREEKKVAKKKEQKKQKRRRFSKFFKNLFTEGKKVTWPTWKKTLFQTGVVIAVVLIFTILILIIDLLFATILSYITTGNPPKIV